MLRRYFRLDELGTTVSTEVVAGLTTFLTMAYIVVVNPGILGAAAGPQAHGALLTATVVAAAIGTQRFGPYTLQAAIAATHAAAESAAETDWNQIVTLYELLLRANPSPVVELNRAVAVAMRDGPEAGLARINALLDRGDLADYHLAHAARADLLRRLGRNSEARTAYADALALTRQEPERRFLERRLAELS